MNQSFSVTFTNTPPDSSSQDLLDLEQDSWESYVGRLTAANMVRYIRNMLFGEAEDSYFDCGLDGEGRCVTVIHAYPLTSDLGYRIYCSYGELGSGIITSFDETEIVEFQNSSTASVKYPCQRIVDREWLGTIYDSQDNPLAHPPIEINGKELIVPEKIWGTVKLTYRVYRRSYGLTITPRADQIEGSYSAAVWAIYDGGIEYLVLSEPPGIDNYSTDGRCGYSSWTNVEFAPDEPPKHPAGDFDKYIDIEYCTQIDISDEDYQSPYWQGQT